MDCLRSVTDALDKIINSLYEGKQHVNNHLYFNRYLFRLCRLYSGNGSEKIRVARVQTAMYAVRNLVGSKTDSLMVFVMH